MVRFFTIAFFILTCATSYGQEVAVSADTVKVGSDSLVTLKNGRVVSVKAYAARFNPRRALLYSALLPGAGQIYNKKYWKLPLVYGGFVILGSAAVFYDSKYNLYRSQVIKIAGISGAKSPDGLTEAQLRNVVDAYRRQRDFFIILNGFWYALQLIDAHVDAHLKEFDLNPQLKLSLRPDSQQNNLTGRTNGFAITLTF